VGTGQKTNYDCGGGLVLRCGSGEFAESGQTAVSVRQHVIKLSAERPAEQIHCAPATVARQVSLGSHRSYLVTLGSGEAVHSIAAPEVAFAEGQSVWVYFPPEHCRALAH
jgi:iron(III) transport system ATP-binding protein